MRWRNHQIITGIAIYSITGGFLSAWLAVAGSVLPDVLEMRGLIKHRTITHWPYPYLVMAAVLYVLEYRTPSIMLHLLFFMLLGVIFHLFLDGLSVTGIPVGLKPTGKRRVALNLYTTFRSSEIIAGKILKLPT
jgi:membrane-bound metal-dependent hydrolase YbcI (DUF457 family)